MSASWPTVSLARRRRFRPRPGATLAALCGVAILLGLGTWQVERLHWKEELIATIEARGAAEPIALPPAIDPEALEFRRVRLTGRFRHDAEFHLLRPQDGEPGYRVITPLVLEDGRAVMVDRGWVPAARRTPESRAAGRVADTVAVEGIVREGGWHGFAALRPSNRPQDNVWLWPDLPAMAARAGLEDAVTEIYVVAEPAETPGGFPVADGGRIELRNDHLQYALTWYALAIALLVIYVVHQSRPRDDRPDA